MSKLTIRKNVTLDYSEDDWDIYTSMRDSNLIAKILNNTFEVNVNSGGTRYEVEKAMSKVMEQYKQYGTNDTEPWRVLERLLEKVFPSS